MQFTIEEEDVIDQTLAVMDMILLKKFPEGRRCWLQEKGHMAEIEL